MAPDGPDSLRRVNTAPLWLAVLLAILVPVMALIGVLWTQRASDRRSREEADRALIRAREEAELRLRAQRESDIAETKLQAYIDIFTAMRERYDLIYAEWRTGNHEKIEHSKFSRLATVIALVAEQDVVNATADMENALIQFNWDRMKNERDRHACAANTYQVLMLLGTVMRQSYLGEGQGIGGSQIANLL